MKLKSVHAGVLDVAYQEYGDGWPCIMLHGFPYDVLAFSETACLLAGAGARVIVPYLRGYGPTRFLSPDTPRSGEQAALATDLLALMDALNIERAVVGGYDWGGRAACIVSALWPNRVDALISGNSYNIQDIARSMEPASATEEASYWYQYYFHSERGRNGLENNRRDITNHLWQLWSPDWKFSSDTFEQTAKSFDNPDFVETVIHSYRHRFALVDGDPSLLSVEARLQLQPVITVPAITIDGATDGVSNTTHHHANMFTGPHEHRVFSGTGHNLPQEQPSQWAQAVLDARSMT